MRVLNTVQKVIKVATLIALLSSVATAVSAPTDTVVPNSTEPSLAQASFASRPQFDMQLGHQGSVQALAFAPDGKMLASGSFDRTIKLWDYQSGRLLRTLIDPNGAVAATSGIQTLAFAPDGKTLFSRSGSNAPVATQGVEKNSQVSLWDVATGELRSVIALNQGDVRALAVAPNGQSFVTAGIDDIRVWQTTTGARLASWKGHAAPVEALAYAADGLLLASGSRDSTIKLWDTRTWKLVRTLNGSRAPVLTLAFAPDSKTLASGCADVVNLWDVAHGGTPRILQAPFPTQTVTWSPDGASLASSHAPQAIIWDAASGAVQHRLDGGGGCIAFNPQGSMLASSTWNDIALWDTRTGTHTANLRGTYQLNSIAWDPDGDTFVTAGNDASLKLWDAHTAALLKVIKTAARVYSLSFAPNGGTLATAATNGNVYLWDTTNWQLRHTFIKPHRDFVSAVAFSPDGSTLATGGGDETVKLWNVPAFALRATLSGFVGAVTAVAFAPDGQQLATGSSNETRVWDVAHSFCQWTRQNQGDSAICAVGFSVDGQRVLSAAADGTAQLLEATTGKVLNSFSGQAQPIATAAFAPDNSIVVAAGVNGLQSWNPKSSALVWATSAADYVGSPRALAFAPDSKSCATVGEDGLVRLWSINTSGTLRPLMMLLPIPVGNPDFAQEMLDYLALTPQGYYAGTAGADALLGFRIGDEPVNADKLKPQLNRPDLIKQALANQKLP